MLHYSAIVKGQLYSVTTPDRRQHTCEFSGLYGEAYCFTSTTGDVITIPRNGWQYWSVSRF